MVNVQRKCVEVPIKQRFVSFALFCLEASYTLQSSRIWLVVRQRIRKHLLIFSMAAPTLTLITYFGIGQEGKETLSSFNATGIAMLFSAGTFLYVATVHVLAELTQNPHPTHSHLPTVEPSNLKGQSTQPHHGLQCTELCILVIGCLAPLVLTVGHHH